MDLVLEYTVAPGDNGMTYKDILRFKLKISANQRKIMKEHPGSLKVNGKEEFATRRAVPGDKITAVIPSGKSENIASVPGKIDILFEDENLFIVNKKSGIATHPTGKNRINTLANFMMFLENSRGEDFVFRPVNRLDKETSGAIVIAKSAYIQNLLTKQLHSPEFSREYLAIVCAELEGQGVVNQPIKRAEGSVIKREINPLGASAVTEYEVIKSAPGHSLIKLKLKTGRTHQIRVHMSYIGAPLLGDFLYGEKSEIISRCALHSSKVSFIHPKSGRRIEIEASIPEDFKDAAKTLSLI
jgi:23S rRNA pseudouridine1911/1915/1917 synthase